MSCVGRVHSFETFGTVDGPGIRFVIFFQGCNFRCLYCHNPDTWSFEAGSMMTVKEVIGKIKKVVPYLISSGGGITVSGGEPLLQIEFLTEIFKECKKLKLHTAIDTNGCIDINNDKFDELLKYTDLVLLDIKHMDSTIHKKITGCSNKDTLEFAKYLNVKDIPIWIRYVVVPGFTDDEENIYKLHDFIKTLSNIDKIEVIPFHKMAEYKWDKLQFNYVLKNINVPTSYEMERIKKIINNTSEFKIHYFLG
jgi:pyruvate formate lyase activating enzyme